MLLDSKPMVRLVREPLRSNLNRSVPSFEADGLLEEKREIGSLVVVPDT
ncbi:hypothetical protein SAMN05443245_6999 [Paraburkholderia fungorum]|uniref:Uncharacterized protein n=1 Tax=Paraburkholderia fungorum TaxID=134537 RepID=A0A1H1JNY4_9BURK|nr:hypothetical protein SAMN05443245_6999 [Paraburkholderia fungorum]